MHLPIFPAHYEEFQYGFGRTSRVIFYVCMVTGKQTQHVHHREQCTKTILWSNINATMSKSYFGPEYCVGDSDNTTFKSSIAESVSASFTLKPLEWVSPVNQRAPCY